jgi:hypothetical protein
MSSDTMEKFRCWRSESVGQTVFPDIGALASDADAIFLAAHTPVELEHSKGSEADPRKSGEAQVLDALLQRVGDTERNTLVAVTGGSGSGKSHVVRWVNAHVDRNDSRFHVLYVPRAVQTLRSLLRRIVDGLPGVEGTELLARVDAAMGKASPGEIKDRVVSEMKIALNWTIQERDAEDDETTEEAAAREDRNSLLGDPDGEGRRRDGLADLFDVPAISQALLRADGRIDRLVRSYFDETSRRDDEVEEFTTEDLPIRERGIRRSLQGRPALADLWDIVGRTPEDTLALLDEALRLALPPAIGLRAQAGGDTLTGLFSASRRALRDQGQELVLIFEDLAQFGLVDGELYDQFVTPPSNDLAPLRVVFAVTDGAYSKLERTVRTRVAHEFRVGGSALSEPQAFVGRYLNLVRVGRSRTQNLWSEGGAKDSSAWMENACATRDNGQECRFRGTCHAAFGAVEIDGLGAVGLYPYNAHALRRTVTQVRTDAAKVGAEATPRQIVDECVSTNLLEADVHIAAGDYPHSRVQSQFDFETAKFRDVVVAGVPLADADRVYLARVIWGDEESLAPGIEEAFALPMYSGPTPTANTGAGAGTEPGRGDLVGGSVKGGPAVASLTASPLESLLAWQNQGSLPEGERDGLPEADINTYRTTLYHLTLSRLPLDQDLVHIHSGRGKEILGKIFSQNSFTIEDSRGRGAAEGAVRIHIERTPENVRLLAAAYWFRDHGHFDPAQAKWPWPVGQDPEQMLVELEDALDRWAALVRERFLAVSGGADVARDALGLRALALAAVGQDATDLQSTGAVLNPPAASPWTAGSAWSNVDSAAKTVLGLPVEEYLGEFAAVRQGQTGDPQLVDTLDLDVVLARFLSDPITELARLAESGSEPAVTGAARAFRDALLAAADDERADLALHSVRLQELLEGCSPQEVGALSRQVGSAANAAGLFRPNMKWREFESATDMLADAQGSEFTVTLEPGPGGVLVAQNRGRVVRRLAQALGFVAGAMDQTAQECRRSGAAEGDAGALRSEVSAQVVEINQLVQSLAKED